jgi:hypothetical protein
LPVKTCSDLVRRKLGNDFKRMTGIRRPLVRRTLRLLHRPRIDAGGTTTDGEDGIDDIVHWCSCYTAFTDVNALVNPVLAI